jgi:hypothetical protein
VNRQELEHEGFRGFVAFATLREEGFGQVPPSPGVYVVLLEGHDEPEFLESNPGGRFKQRDPTVEIDVLRKSTSGKPTNSAVEYANSPSSDLGSPSDIGVAGMYGSSCEPESL